MVDQNLLIDPNDPEVLKEAQNLFKRGKIHSDMINCNPNVFKYINYEPNKIEDPIKNINRILVAKTDVLNKNKELLASQKIICKKHNK